MRRGGEESLRRLAAFLVVLLLALAAAPAAAASWRLARGPSEVSFRVGHLVLLTVEGRFRRFTGSVETAGPGFEGASIEAVVDVTSVSTGHRDRDRELLGEEFFAADRFPTIRFVGRAVERLGGSRYRVRGELTIRDVTREVELEAVELERRRVRGGGVRTLISATTGINRFDYGLDWSDTWAGRAVLDETVEIRVRAALDLEPAKPAPAPR